MSDNDKKMHEWALKMGMRDDVVGHGKEMEKKRLKIERRLVAASKQLGEAMDTQRGFSGGHSHGIVKCQRCDSVISSCRCMEKDKPVRYVQACDDCLAREPSLQTGKDLGAKAPVKTEPEHKEAFCIMLYVSDDGMELEKLWNSRDGVTPFIISNRDHTKHMSHTHWGTDVFDPGFIPPVGTRIFVDMTSEDLLETKKRFVDKHWNDSQLPMKDHSLLGPLGKEGAAKHLAKSEMRKGMPNIVVVTEERQRMFGENLVCGQGDDI